MEVIDEQQRLNYLLLSNPAIIFSCRADMSPGITFISANVKRILGYEVDDFVNDPLFWISHVHPQDRKIAKEQYPNLLRLKQWEREYRFQHKDGSYRWMHDELRVVEDEQGEVLEIVGTWLDITEKRAQQKAAERSYQLARYFLEQGSSVFVVLDENGLVKNVNRFTATTLGYSQEEIIGRNWFENFVPAVTKAELEWMFNVSIANKKPVERYFESPILTAGGDERMILWQYVVIDEDGSTAMICNGEDMTESILSQRMLKESEELYRLIAENSTDIIHKINPANGVFTYVSPSCIGILGYQPDEMVGTIVTDYLQQEDHATIRELYESIKGGITEFVMINYRFRHKDGRYVWFESNIRCIYEENGQMRELVVVSRDITRRKEMERELEEMSAMMRTMHERIPVISFKVTEEGVITRAFGRGLERLDLKDNELVGQNAFELFPERVADLKRVLPGGDSDYLAFESTGEANGRPYWLQNYYYRDMQNDRCMSGLALDVTEQKLAQQDLFKTQEMYRMLINNFPNLAVFAFDKDLRILLADGHELAANGFGADLIGKTMYEVIPHLPQLIENYERAFKGVASVFELAARGSIFQVEVRPVRGMDGDIIAATVISQNITERSRLEQMLMQTTFEHQDDERRLISLMLHDGLGQQLAGLSMKLENLKLEAAAESEQAEIYKDVKKTINKIVSNVRQISHELMPSTIMDFGLESSLEDLCFETQTKNNLKLNFQSYGKKMPLSYNIAVGLYRITEDLLQWACRNNDKGLLQIQLTHHDDSVVLVVDDERTLQHADIEYFENAREFFNITSRTRALNGRLTVEAKPEKGTLVSVEIPIR